MNEKQAWHAGLLVGTLMNAGIDTLPLLDSHGNYSDEIRIKLKLPSVDFPVHDEVDITIKVLES